MKAFILSVLLTLAVSVSAEDLSDPRVQKWHKEQAESQERVKIKYAELMIDAKSGFVQRCDDEVLLAEAKNDPIMFQPDWCEKIAERVIEKFYKQGSSHGNGVYVDDELMAKIKSQRGSKPQGPLPNYVLPSPLVGSWYYQGRFYKGSIFKVSADAQKVYVTSDWDNYNGSWLNIADLDIGTRINLNAATEKEKADYTAAQKEREADNARSAAIQAEYMEKMAKKREAEQAAQTEAQKLAVQQEIAALIREQNELLKQQGQPQINIYAPGGIK